MTVESLKITALTPQQAAGILAAAGRRQVTVDQVRQIVERAALLRADGTFSLIEYTAYLAGEATRGGFD